MVFQFNFGHRGGVAVKRDGILRNGGRNVDGGTGGAGKAGSRPKPGNDKKGN